MYREYAGPVELRAMQSLAERISPRTGYRLVGDLAWNSTLAHGRTDPTAVWHVDDTVVAWGWLEPGNELMLQVDPAHPGVADDVLAWAEPHADGPLTVAVAGTETVSIAALEARGYQTQDGPFMALLDRRLDADVAANIEPPRLPDGFRIRGLESAADVEQRAAVHRSAFGSSRVTTERHAAMTRTWPYRPEFDLVVEAPDGAFAAYCQGWFDPVNRLGEFEPVGTHPDHRRRGLARAVCTAVLRAFARAGGERAVVYTRGDAGYPIPKLVYESLGFQTYATTRTYRQPG